MRSVSSLNTRYVKGLIAGFIAGLGCLIAFGAAQAQTQTVQIDRAQINPAQTEPAQAESTAAQPRYKVELLVFRHLDAPGEGFTQTQLRDFSSALDLLTPPEPVAETDAPSKTVKPSKPHATEGSPASGAQVTGEGDAAENEEKGPLAPPVELVEQQSEAMQHAWRRLRGSAGFRPEQFMAWEQSMAQPFPFIRVHDLEVLKELDPLTGLALGEAADGKTSGEPVEFNDTTKRPYERAANAETAPLPQTIRFYRIDGSSRLRRSRFLHLDLDIEYREPELRESGAASIPLPASDSPAGPEGSRETDEPAWVVYKLSQSRQVQTAKYEYFDGPNIAVLALVTRIDALSTEEPLVEEAGAEEVRLEETRATGTGEVQP